MAFPANWARIAVTATFVNRSDGSPARGRVVFSSPQVVTADGTVVVAQDIVAVLDSDGSIAVDLLATDDPDCTPQGWAYTVEEHIPGARPRYLLTVPHDSAGLDLATVTPAVPAPARPVYTLEAGAVNVGDLAVALEDVAPGKQRLNLTLPPGGIGGTIDWNSTNW